MSQRTDFKERRPWSINGFIALAILFVSFAFTTFLFVLQVRALSSGNGGAIHVFLLVFSIVVAIILGVAAAGLRILKPNEALVLTLFGKYHGTLRGEGYYYVIPFCVGINPAAGTELPSFMTDDVQGDAAQKKQTKQSNRMSLKAMTLNNGKQKINDALGNPIIIGIVVIWRIKNTAQAAFNVDNYIDYLSTQADSALRNIVREYPYDGYNSDAEKSLRGSSQEVADRIRDEIQSKVNIAGLEILEARITHLAYAPEIASAMLQRQQASAIIDARAMIVDGAVGMVEMALRQLEDGAVIDMDDERKAQMVSNLLVVLCANHDAQPVVNSGSLY